jgi:hypothetical protein
VQEVAIEAVAGRALVTAAVGRSLAEAVATAREAARMGADAVMAHQPLDPSRRPRPRSTIFSPSPRRLRCRSSPMCARTTSGSPTSPGLAAHENLAGIKFATPNLMLLADCIRATAHLPAIWVCGLAEGWAAPFYALGAKGFTSGLVNVVPERSLAIHAAGSERGDFRRGASGRSPRSRRVRDRWRTMHNKRRQRHGREGGDDARRLEGRWATVRPPGLVELDTPTGRLEHRDGVGLSRAGMAQAARIARLPWPGSTRHLDPKTAAQAIEVPGSSRVDPVVMVRVCEGRAQKASPRSRPRAPRRARWCRR